MNVQAHFAIWIFYTARFWGFIAILLLNSISIHATGSPRRGDTTDLPLNKLLKVIRETQHTPWKLDHEVDPYHRERMLRTDPDNPQYLSLKADQSYVVYDQHDRKEGIWEIDAAMQTITFWCKSINGVSTNSAQPNTYQVTSFTSRKLVFSWQGRHGQIEMVYRLGK